MNKDANIIGSALFRSMGFSNEELTYLISDPELITSAKEENTILIENAQKNTNNIFDSILHSSIKSRLVNDYLVKTDRASMYNSLELRTPFLDRNLLEFLSSLPSNYIIHNKTNKYITKKIAEAYFDKKFIYRDKQGFGIPIGEWMKKEWKKEILEVLNFNNPYVNLNKSYINQLFEEHLSNNHDHTHKIWILYVLNKWSMNYA
jgi:asparagine synthase (glutamine-hydrolysing)